MKHINFYGIKVVGSTTQEVEKDLFDGLKVKRKKFVFGIGSGFKRLLVNYPWYFEFLNEVDLVLFDGRVLYYMAKILGYKVYCNLSLPEYVQLGLAAAKKLNGRVYLLGASKDNNKLAVERLNKKGITTIGHHGYFNYSNPDEMKNIISDINKFRPHLLLIGMSSPHKELISIKYRELLPESTIVLCGGMIDVIAGATKQTPRLLKKMGLAWLYRFFQEPKRLFNRILFDFVFFCFSTFPSLLIQRRHNTL